MMAKEPIFQMIFASIFGELINVTECVDSGSYEQFMCALNSIFDDLEYSFVLKLALGDGSVGRWWRRWTAASKTESAAAVAMGMVTKWYEMSSLQHKDAKEGGTANCMLSIMMEAQKRMESPMRSEEITSDLLVVFFGDHTTGRMLYAHFMIDLIS